MNPKEKSRELFKSMYNKIFDIDMGANVMQDQKRYDAAKQCALIAVELRIDGHFPFTSIEYGLDSLEYLEAIKAEIERL